MLETAMLQLPPPESVHMVIGQRGSKPVFRLAPHFGHFFAFTFNQLGVFFLAVFTVFFTALAGFVFLLF